jgi:hypothetical protein
VWRIARDAPQLVLVAFSISVLVAICKLAVASDSFGHKALRSLLDGMSTVLLVPFQIGGYRLILLGEQPARYIAYYSGRFLPYLKWATVFWLPTVSAEFMPEASLFSVVVLMGFAIAMAVVSLRLALLFPALAAGRLHVTAQDAWRDTRGKIWSVLWVMLVAIVPLTVVLVVWVVMLGMMGTSNLPTWKLALRTALESTMMLIAAVIWMANASLLFDVIGDRVKPAG